MLWNSRRLQAVAFAVPHESLGEDVAAAVVAAPGVQIEEPVLREFLPLPGSPPSRCPAGFWWWRIFPRDPRARCNASVSRGPSRGLGPGVRIPGIRGGTPGRRGLPVVLGRDRVGRNDNFFSSGGDSLKATQAVNWLQQALGLRSRLQLSSGIRRPLLAGVAAPARGRFGGVGGGLGGRCPPRSANACWEVARDPGSLGSNLRREHELVVHPCRPRGATPDLGGWSSVRTSTPARWTERPSAPPWRSGWGGVRNQPSRWTRSRRPHLSGAGASNGFRISGVPKSAADVVSVSTGSGLRGLFRAVRAASSRTAERAKAGGRLSRSGLSS